MSGTFDGTAPFEKIEVGSVKQRTETMNQIEKYPPLCEVVVIREMTGVRHEGIVYGYVGIGANGHVQDHTEDGRAMFVLNGNIHTFDDPDLYLVVTRLPAPTPRQLFDEFWGLLNKIMVQAGDTIWADETTTAHEALCDLAEKYDPKIVEEFIRRMEE